MCLRAPAHACTPLSLYLILTCRTYLQYRAKPSKLVVTVANLDSLVISSAIYADLPCPARVLYPLSAEIAVEFIFQAPLSPSPFRAGCNSDLAGSFPQFPSPWSPNTVLFLGYWNLVLASTSQESCCLWFTLTVPSYTAWHRETCYPMTFNKRQTERQTDIPSSLPPAKRLQISIIGYVNKPC